MALVIGALGFYVYNTLFSPLVGSDSIIQIPRDSEYADVKQILADNGIAVSYTHLTLPTTSRV